MKFLLFTIVTVSTSLSLYAERDIVSISQPLSLLGTELEAYPLGKDQSLYADIFATPTVISSAYPESIVQAIALPHQFYNSPQGFPEESNVIVLADGRLDAAWGEKRHLITIDFSKFLTKKDLGVTLKQLCDLTLICLSRSLQQGYADGKSFDITWKLPTSANLDLPSTLIISAAEQGAAANP